MLRFAVLFVSTLMFTEARKFALTVQYPGTMCEGQPAFVQVDQVANCTVQDCKDFTIGTSSLVTCTSTSNSQYNIENFFGRTPYILRKSYNDKNCFELQTIQAFNVATNCVKNEATGMFVRTGHENNGSISVQYFLEATCSLGSLHSVDYISKETLEDQSCDASAQQWYVSVANERALALMVDSDTPSVMSTSIDEKDASTTGAETTMTLITTGMSSSSDETSSTNPFEPEVVTNTSEVVNTTAASYDSSSNDDDTGSSYESGQSRSSSVKSQGSHVSITSLELDTASSTGSAQENFTPDTSTSGSNTPMNVAATKSSISIGSGTITGIVMASLIIAVVVIGSIIRRHHSKDYNVQSYSSDPYWGQTSPIHRQHYTQKLY